jgi:hypothetical protein
MPEPSTNAHFIKIAPRCLAILILVLKIVVRLVGANDDKMGSKITISWERHLVPCANVHNNTCRAIKVKGLEIIEIRMWLLTLVPAGVRPALCRLAKYHIEWLASKWNNCLGMFGMIFHPAYLEGTLLKAHQVEAGVVVGVKVGRCVTRTSRP